MSLLRRVAKSGVLCARPLTSWRREYSPPAGYDKPFYQCETANIDIAHKKGADLLHDPVYNKGLGFSSDERERLGLRGLLPPVVYSQQKQVRRMMQQYWDGPPHPTPASGVSDDQVRKWIDLAALKDRNEALYYKLLVDNFLEMAPVVYTPTVGWACANYHKIYHRPRGMFFAASDKGAMASMVYNWPEFHVDAIVITDGSRILGLGDLGLGGVNISIGKLDLYVAAAGFRPDRVLPCVIDVGTNNMRLRNDRNYLGLKQDRVEGEEFVELMDEVVTALMQRWPNAVLQFEDFSTQNAFNLLNRYRGHYNMFNDDIQGTAATALAGVYGAMRVLGTTTVAITEQTFVVCGAGSAGMGVVDFLCKAMQKQGLEEADAAARFYILDHEGLITEARAGLESNVMKFAQKTGKGLADGATLPQVVGHVKPTALVGLTGVGGIFTEEVLALMAAGTPRPIVFPLSNPTHKLECKADVAQRVCNGRAIFASGSPQPDVTFGDVKIASSQGNNMYVFPGVALGAHLLQTGQISDNMLMAAAEAVPDLLTEEDLEQNRVYPSLRKIRKISAHVAYKVMEQAVKDGHYSDNRTLFLYQTASEQRFRKYIEDMMYVPSYNECVYMPPGILE
ncbi:hypothetical protein CYMTET_45497 [Cymbomonas tetramitiformis]|uniref:Malic enzyme n=1 Tax=Cymbomonas tetramitiformis TaxID=36881 RepID=A0AAE0EZM4_9CHLO|nr:hypothetical protein CYMTET_45497 [Cymbomonas tetramitiformis]|eukprot:gene7546-8984_t